MRKMLILSGLLICFYVSHAQVDNTQRNAALQLVKANSAALSLSLTDINDVIVSGTYQITGTDITMVYLQQSYLGIPVYNQMQVLAFRNGQLVSNAGSRLPGMEKLTRGSNEIPSVSAVQAVRSSFAERNIPEKELPVPVSISADGHVFEFGRLGVATENIKTELIWLPGENNLVRLAWQVQLAPNSTPDLWLIRIDAKTGSYIAKTNLTITCNWDNKKHSLESHLAEPHFKNEFNGVSQKQNIKDWRYRPFIVSDANYTVIKYPAESPQHAGGAPSVDNKPWLLTPGNATSLGWHNDGTIINESTKGNNVWAQEDRDNNNNTFGNSTISTTSQPTLNFPNVYNFTLSPTEATLNNQLAAITNLFYWNNLLHDVSYTYGFDEVSGNFQNSNQGRGGLGSDYVIADAQDAGGSNNANFGTPVDGSRPRMQMYLFTSTSPNRDGDLDNGIISHEYTHGISNRLTGGPANSSCLDNAEEGGEGWSDYFALMMTTNWATATVNDGPLARAMGTYVLGQPVTGAGIRSHPYSTDPAINPLTYSFVQASGGEVHDIGEVWCVALWEMTWEIIKQDNAINPNLFVPGPVGSMIGNSAALKLVVEGMRLQPCSPGFLDARNAILKADTLFFNKKYSCSIWKAFAKRGMGKNASQGSPNSTSDQVVDFTTDASTLVLNTNIISVPETQNIVYTNKVTASGCVLITNFLLTDTLPANVTYVSGGSYNPANRVVSFNPVTIAPGANQTYSFTVNVNAGAYFPPLSIINEPVAGTTIPAFWTETSTTAIHWTVSSTQSHSAPNSFFTADLGSVSDQVLATTNSFSLGAAPPTLSFWHFYSTEPGWDGGVVEISTNGGTTWSDIGAANFISGGYNGTLVSSGNPLAGRAAFNGNSGGFIKSTINMIPYANQANVKLRFRFASDGSVSGTGWFVDDIEMKNIAVVNMRTNLFDASNNRVSKADTVNIILPANGCAAPAAGAITQPTCAVSTGSVILSDLPATGTWTINPGAVTGTGTSTTISGLAAGTYNFIVSTAGGCTSAPSANVVINVQPVPPPQPTAGTITQPTCTVMTGTVILNGLPATGTWTINPGAINGTGTSTIISGLSTGTYNFTVTTAGGCTSAPSANVVINAVPAIPSAPGVGTITQPTCTISTGSVLLGGLPAAGTWIIYPGAIIGSGTSTTISGLPAGLYNFTVTIAGCTSAPSAAVLINTSPLPTVNAVISQMVCSNAATATINFTGTLAGTVFNWANNNTSIGLAASGTGNIPSFSAINAGNTTAMATITVTPSYNNGEIICTGLSKTFTITVNPSVTVNTVANQALCNSGTTTAVIFNGTVPGTVYNWTNNNTSIGLAASGTGDIPSFTATNPGTTPVTATITVTPATGNQVINGALSAGDLTESNRIFRDGLVSVCSSVKSYPGLITGGPFFYDTYSFTNSTGISKCVTVSYIANSTGDLSVSAYNGSFNPANLAANYMADGGNSSGNGFGLLSFSFDVPAGATVVLVANGVSAGVACPSYTITINQVPACTGTPKNFTITVNPGPAITVNTSTVTQPTCTVPTGSVVLNGLPATGIWTINPGAVTGTGTTTTIAGLTTGTYNFTVTNAAGCTSAPSNVIINAAPTTPSAPGTGTITQPTCTVPTGTVVLNGLPATGTWTINPGAVTGTGTSANISGLAAGTYNFTVTSTGCMSAPSANVVINEPPTMPSAPGTGIITQPTCAGPTGSVVLNGLPATGTWTVNPGAVTGTGTGITISGLAAGTYNFTVTNAEGCISSASANVVISAASLIPSVDAVINQVACNNTATALINFTGPVAGTVFNWTNDNTAIGLAAAGTGNIPSFAAVNTGNTAVTATINVTPVSNGIAYISNYGSGTVSVINTATNLVVATIPVGTNPSGVSLSPDGSRCYVTNFGSNTVSVINTSTNSVLATIPVGSFPNGVSVSPDGSRVYVVNSNSFSVSVINSATNTIITTIAVGLRPFGLSVSPDGSRVYVTNSSANTVSVINTATNLVVATISVGSTPYGVSINPDGSRVYVTNSNSNTVSVINTATNSVIATIPAGANPTGISVNPDGSRVYVSNSSNSISVINTANNSVVAAIAVPGPIGLSVSPDGSRLYAANQNSNTVSVINTATNSLITAVPVGANPYAFGNFIFGFVCPGASKTFTITVKPTATINSIPDQSVCNNAVVTPIAFTSPVAGMTFTWANNTPSIGLAASGTGNIASFTATNTTNAPVTATVTVTVSASGVAYIPNSNSGSVSVINTATNSVVASIFSGPNPECVAVSPDGSRVYVANVGSSTVSVINTATNSVVATIPVGFILRGIAVSPDGSRVYVAKDGAFTVAVINTATNSVVAAIPVGFGPRGIVVSPDGSRVYVANSDVSSNSISVINAATNLVVTTIPAGSGAFGVSINPDGSRLYVANLVSNNVSVINTATNLVEATVSVGSGPRGISVSPDGSRVYTANGGSNTVSVINTATNSVTATIPVGTNPFGISVSPDGSRVYAVNNSSGNVSVINTTTNTVVTTIPVGSQPVAFGNFITGGPVCAGTSKTFTITVNPAPAITISAPAITQPTCAIPTGTITVNATTGAGTLEYSTDNGSNWQLNSTFANLTPGSYNIKVRLQGSACVTTYSGNPVVLNTAACNTKVIPGKIEAEDFDTRLGGMYAIPTTDVGGGQKVVGITNGSWMDYNVTVMQSGMYTVNFRVATTQVHTQFQIKLGAAVLATIDIPGTGDWNNWVSFPVTNVPLTAGPQTIRIQSTNNENCDFNWTDWALTTSNAAPTANAGTNQTIVLPTNQVTLSGSGAANNGGTITYGWTQTSGPNQQPAPVITTPTAATTNVTGLIQGVYTFRLTVTRNDNQTATSDVTVTVNAASPPTANAGTNQVIVLPTNQVTLSGSGAANNGGTITYGWTQTSGPSQQPAPVITTPTTASTNVTGLIQGVYTFRLTVTRNDNQAATSDVTVTVNAATPPTANAGTNQVIVLPTNQVSLFGSGAANNGGTITYGWTQISGPNQQPAPVITTPTAASTNVTGLIQGVYTFRLTVTRNDNQTATSDVTVTVNPVSNGKTIPGKIEAEDFDTKLGGMYAIPTTDVGGGQKVVGITNGSWMDYNVTVMQSGMYTVNFRVATTQVHTQFQIKLGAAVLATIDIPGTGDWNNWVSFPVTNVPLTAGPQTIRIQSTNNENCDFNWTDWALTTSNAAPTANAGTNQTIVLPTNQVTLSGSGAANNGGTITYGWTQTSGPGQQPAPVITTPTAATTNVTGLIQGVYTFRLTVTRNDNQTATSDVTVTVNAATPPTANAGTNQVIVLPTNQVSLSGSGAANNGGTITYGWTQISGPNQQPAPVITTPTAATTNVTGLIQGVYTFRLTVTRNDNQTATSDVTVTVNAATPPTANAGTNQVIVLPTNQVTLSGSGAANNGGTITYGWTQISGPNQQPAPVITTPTAASTNVTGLIQGVYTFRLTVTRNDNQTATSDVTVTINPASNGKTIPGKIEAEDFDTKLGGMYAIPTTDAGGGLKVVGITNGSWMDYNVTVMQSGMYTVNFRVATTKDHTQFQVKLGNTVLATINIPNTGGWDNWLSVPVTNVPLTAGPQTIRIQSTNNENCDFNWTDWTLTGSLVTTVNNMMVTEVPIKKEITVHALSLSVFPNPAESYFNLKVQSKSMERLVIKVVDIAGRQVQQLEGMPGQTIRFGDKMVNGTYLVEVSQGSERVVTKVVKQ